MSKELILLGGKRSDMFLCLKFPLFSNEQLTLECYLSASDLLVERRFLWEPMRSVPLSRLHSSFVSEIKQFSL